MAKTIMTKRTIRYTHVAKDGTSVTVSKTETAYASSTSGTTPPTTGWTTSIPTVAAGSYLWTRTTTTFSDGKTAVSYVCARQGVNGSTPKYSDFGAQLVNDLKASEALKADFCTALKADVGFKADIKDALMEDDDFVESTQRFDFNTDTGTLKVHTIDGGYVNINFKNGTYATCTQQMCQVPVAFGRAT